jgi:group I intron endonuclease
MNQAVAIYTIRNIVNQKHYVGIAVDLKKRWSAHRRCSGHNIALYSAIKKYGLENFVFTHVADAFSWEDACEIEKSLIDAYDSFNNGYNLTRGGDGAYGRSGEKHPFFGLKRPDFAKKISGEAHPMFGVTRPDLSARNSQNSGENHPFFGKKRPEHGAKVSQALKGKKKSPEHMAKVWASRRANAARLNNGNVDGISVTPNG